MALTDTKVTAYCLVKASDKVGKVIAYDPDDDVCTWKLEVDGVCDWFGRRACRPLRQNLNLCGKSLNDTNLLEALPDDINFIASLNFGINAIGESGSQAIASILLTNTVLTELDLRSNQIGDVGVGHIAQALKSNTSLIKLDLRRNSMTDAGAVTIASLLETCPRVEKIDLQNNKLTERGVQSMTHAIQASGCMTELDARHNFLSEYGTKEAPDMAKYRDELLHALNNNRNRPIVLTMRWSPVVGNDRLLNIVVSSMGGQDMAEHTVSIDTTLLDLRDTLKRRIGTSVQRPLKLVSPDGQLLEDPTDRKSLESLLIRQ